MRRIVMLVGLMALLVALGLILTVSMASAQPSWHSYDNEADCGTCHFTNSAIHGPWTDTPDACARCHRTHSAVEDDLLAMPKDALCLFCHGSVGGLANTNVLDGVLRLTGSPALRGGGFDQTKMNTSSSTPAGNPTEQADWLFPVGSTLSASTSKHTLGVEATVWGAWNSDDDPALADPNAGDENTSLQCVSCHDPHAYGQTYRMLHREPEGSGINTHAAPNDTWNQYRFVTDQLTYAEYNPGTDILSYATTDYTDTWYATPDVLDPTDGTVLQVKSRGSFYDMYSQQLGQWCASCHDRYHAPKTGFNGVGTTPTGDPIFNYQHATGDDDPTPIVLATGTHDGSDDSADLVDSTVNFGTLGVIAGDMVENLTDGSAATVTALAGGNTTLVGELHGGTDNDWDTGDSYEVISHIQFETTSCGYSCHLHRDLSCVSCHVAHGTSAAMTSVIAAQPWPGEKYGASDVRDDGQALGQAYLFEDTRTEFTGGSDQDDENRSNLLRLDNRGVCQEPACHPKGKDGYTVPFGSH